MAKCCGLQPPITLCIKVIVGSVMFLLLRKKNLWTEAKYKLSVKCFREASKVMVDNLQLIDADEGIRAFIEKRLPQWQHTTDRQH